MFLVIVVCLFSTYFFDIQNKNTGEFIIQSTNNDIRKINISLDNFDNVKQRILSNPKIKSISQNYNYHISAYPNDPEYISQDYLKQINAEQAWTWVTDANDVIVAVIDTGIDYNHPDLKDNIWKNGKEIPDDGIDNDQNGYIDDYYGWDFVNNKSDNSVKLSVGYNKHAVNHGTAVAGIIGAVGGNKEGITGVAWKIKMMSLRALDSQGNGNTYDVARAIDYAIKNGANIINLSFVGDNDDEILRNSIERAYNAGVIVVASSGNEMGAGTDLTKNPKYPICYDLGKNTVIGVGSVDKDNQLSTFSNYGESCIDILAPGENIYSTKVYQPQLSAFSKKYGNSQYGTSYAAPMVTGAVALIKSIDRTFSNEEIIQILKDSAKNISFKNFSHRKQIGFGLLDVNQAIIEARRHKANKEISIITTQNYSNKLNIKIFNQKTKTSLEKILPSNNYNYHRVESGDVDGDGKQEIIIMSFRAPNAVIYTYSNEFKLLAKFTIKSKSIPSISIGDLYNTKREKIIIGHSNEPKLEIYDFQGTLLNSFYAYNKDYKFGLSVSVCDYDNDKQMEIITAPGIGGGPHIKIFDKNGGLKDNFFAGNKNFRGGLNIDCKTDNFLNEAQIAVAPKSGSSSYILIYNSKRELINSFMAYQSSYKKEVYVKIYDVDSDYQNEIITSPGIGGGAHIKIFEKSGKLINEFFAYNKNQNYGSYIGLLKKDEFNK